MQLKRRRKKILKLFIKNTKLSTDVINLILGYGLHSVHNEELYSGKCYIRRIPLDVVQFDRILYRKKTACQHGNYHPDMCNYITLHNEPKNGKIYIRDYLSIQCCCGRWHEWSYNIEYDGIIILHFHRGVTVGLKDGHDISLFKLIIE